MKFTLITRLLLTTAVAGLCAEALAHERVSDPDRGGRDSGWDRPDRDEWDQPDRDQWDRPGQDREIFVERVNRQVRNETIPLRLLLNIGREYRGLAIRRVVLVSDRAGHQARATLVGDRGRVLAQRDIVRNGRTILTPRRETVIGEDTRRLALLIDGTVFVDRIIVILEDEDSGYELPPPFPPRPPFPPHRPVPPDIGTDIIVEKPVYHRVYGNEYTPLRQLLGIGPDYRGYDLDRVIITMRSDYRQGRAWLEFNGRPVGPGVAVGPRTTTYEFVLRGHNIIGEDLQRLQLRTQGNMTIDYVAAVLKSGSWGGGDGYIGRPPGHGGRR